MFDFEEEGLEGEHYALATMMDGFLSVLWTLELGDLCSLLIIKKEWV